MKSTMDDHSQTMIHTPYTLLPRVYTESDDQHLFPSISSYEYFRSYHQLQPSIYTMSNPTRIATTVLASAAVLAGSYALYFDYQRRNNPEFRKSISVSLTH